MKLTTKKSPMPFTLILGGLTACSLLWPSILMAAGTGSGETAPDIIPVTFLWIAVILVFAKASSLIERIGQPAVLGELIVGVILGSLYLLGINVFEPIKTNFVMHFLAELGVVILLFQVGMESSVSSMMKVGVPSFLVACTGVILPMAAITYLVGPLLSPGLDSAAYLFLGATMTATSVGITARVLKDIGKTDTSEARIIIGAAVIDDVLGLIILAVVAAIVRHGRIEPFALVVILLKAAIFLGAGVVMGSWLAPRIGSFFSRIHTGVGMKFVIVISFGLVFAYIASLMGLAPIVGAFTAGLILKPVYFEGFDNPAFVNDLNAAIIEEPLSSGLSRNLKKIIETYSHNHIEVFTEHLGHFLIPIFFVLTGMQVKIATLADPKTVIIAGGILVAAVLTKVAAGIAAGKGQRRLVVGIGMIPRGEVGLIFANMGKDLGIMDDTLFTASVIVIMMTTLITPPILGGVFKDKTKAR